MKKIFERNLMEGVVNPFSDTFLDTWKLWKEYRWDEHKFRYKGLMSEQAALMKLTRLALGDEQMAVKIVMQSIEGPWSGFFALPENKKINGQPITEKQYSREDFVEELSSRPYNRK